MATILAKGKMISEDANTRLVNALEDAGIDILHRCGGKAKCTTCRVKFISGEPAEYHPNEKAKLEESGNLGKFRLSCHILCEGDMEVEPLLLLSESDLDDPGPRVADEIPT